MSRGRVALAATGCAVGLAGVLFFLTGVPARQWAGVGVWLGGGVAAHDAVLAPLMAALGLVALRRLPIRWHPVVRTTALALATVAVIGLPLLATR